MEKTINTTQVNKDTVFGDILNDTIDNLALFY